MDDNKIRVAAAFAYADVCSDDYYCSFDSDEEISAYLSEAAYLLGRDKKSFDKAFSAASDCTIFGTFSTI